jgi:hypothetical protein
MITDLHTLFPSTDTFSVMESDASPVCRKNSQLLEYTLLGIVPVNQYSCYITYTAERIDRTTIMYELRELQADA